MKPYVLLLVIMVCFSSCSVREREKELEERSVALDQKEQELLLKEQTLKLKEDELSAKEHRIDSTLQYSVQDSTAVNPVYLGVWHVRMNCVETSCTGSAVGDSKIESWTIDSADNGIIARARVGDQLVRVYSGRQQGSYLQLSSEEGAGKGSNVRMTVRLTISGDGLEGRREINRQGDCRIVYSLELKRVPEPA